MSAYMRDWIRPLVKRELATAVEGKTLVAKASKSHIESGKLIVHLTEGKSIQINEFISHSPEYLLWVSDSFTRIRAVFTKRATESFQRKYKRPFSKGTLGAVVGITDYFLVESFMLQGSEGSGNFGSPVHVEELEAIKNLILPLSDQIDSSGSSCSDSQQDLLSPVRSQAGGYAESSSSSGGAIQLNFATQAPHDTSEVIHSQNHTVTIQSFSEKSSLLDVLGAYQPVNRVRDTHINNVKANAEILESQEGNFSKNPRSRVAALTPVFLSSTIDETLVNLKSSPQSSTQEIPNMGVRSSRHNACDPATPTPTDTNTTRAFPNKGFAPTNDATESEKENLKAIWDDSRKYRKPAVSSPRYKVADYRDDESISQWKGLARIPRKYVQIPKDQQKLLERDDSWYSQKPDNREVTLAVPDKVLRELKAFYNRETHPETEAHGRNGNPSGDSRETSEAESENEIDTELTLLSEGLKIPIVRDSQHDQVSFQHRFCHPFSSPDNKPHPDTQRPVPRTLSISRDGRPTSPKSERGSSQASIRDHDGGVYSFSHSQSLQGDMLPEANISLAETSALGDTFEHSSSPLEMEIDVPFGLPSTAEGPQLDLQVERTPYKKSGILFLPSLSKDFSETRFTPSMQKPSATDEPENVSSDPIIPATLEGENVINPDSPKEFATHVFPINVDGYASSSIAQEEEEEEEKSAQHQLVAEFKMFSQRSGHNENNTGTIATPRLLSSDHRTAGGIELHSLKGNITNAAGTSSPIAVVHMSIPNTQTVALPALQSSNDLRGGEETSVLKRSISNASEGPMPAHKRKRTIQSALFSSSQDDEPMVNPSEMAKANRHDFLRQFFVTQDVSNEEPRQSEHDAILSTIITCKDTRLDQIQNRDMRTNFTVKQEREPLLLSPDKGLDAMSQIHEATDEDTCNANSVDSRHGEVYSDLICRPDLTFYTSGVLARCSQGPDLDGVRYKSKNLSSVKVAFEKPMNLFEKFCWTYPTYTESMSTFIKACVYLKQQRDKKKAPLPILWDDFIRLFSTEYPLYVRDCQLTAQAPMNGIAYYNNFVDEPLFSERVVLVTTLPEALLLDSKMTSSSQELIQQASCSYNTQLSNPDSFRGLPEINKQSELSEISTEHIPANQVRDQISSRGINFSESSKGIYVLENQTNGIRSTSENQNDARKPFFETLSQVLIQHCPNPINSGTSKGSDRTELSPTAVSRQSTRHSPRSSPPLTGPSPRNTSKRDQKVENRLENSRSVFTREPLALHRTERKPGKQGLDLRRSRQGSPILGSSASESILTTGLVQGSGQPRPIKSIATAPEHWLPKTPNLPVYKRLGRNTKSMPGPWQTSERSFEKQTNDGSSTMESEKTMRAFVPTPVATFKEFSKAFVPRRKRMSSISGRSPTLTSIIVPHVKTQSTKQDRYPPPEPETQAWTF